MFARRLVAAATAAGVIAAPLAVVGLTAAPAHAAPVTINLVGINDFHGRMNLSEDTTSAKNTNTVKFAGTVANVAASSPNPIVVGAGDLIGASDFASSIAKDQPTIDVLNTIGLEASAVGNHEFDAGWTDLRDRVMGPTDDAASATDADWDYLGANVYAKGTTTPVMQEYATFDKSGVTVAVVGAVTQETSSLVSPDGITALDFGDPIVAVNRVAGQLSDGNAANGEADVIVASFHAGAQTGTGGSSPSTYEKEIAKGGEFAKMASLDASVDVIFNGHTHQVYAWDAPIPGQPGETRPIIQTGEYGNNVGQVVLTVDDATGEVISYVSKNVPRTSETVAELVAKYPATVGKVKDIVDAALANARVIGNVKVGNISADISRAYDGTSEDRASESPLGDLVANALRDKLPTKFGKPDIGVTNPGGLRTDLLFKGNTADNPGNTDGVVTYAEVASVLPFSNDTSIVSLTGAQFKEILEQQWQPAGASRPFLALGLSDNVQTILDPTQPVGSRVTSVFVNGKLLDPAATYKISTFTFLAAGGDNFTSFRKGTSAVTGLLDRDLFRQFFEASAAVAPDFARQQIYATGLKNSYKAGEKANIVFTKLDMSALGAPKNARLDLVKVKNDGSTVTFGTTPVTNGSARAVFTVRGGKEFRIVAQDSKTTIARAVVRTLPAMTTKLFPKAKFIKSKKTRARIKVKLRSEVALAVKGRVKVTVAGHKYNAKVKHGVAKIKLRKFSRPGKYRVVVQFKANDTFQGVRKTFSMRVKR
jgi:5'-nucleotidase